MLQEKLTAPALLSFNYNIACFTKNSIKKSLFLSLVIFQCLFYVQVAAQQPVISSFSPANGPVGTTVVISGSGFNPTAANNIVYFGAVKAAVSAATTTTLSVTAPAGASYQPITVTTAGLTAYSNSPFIITFLSGSGGINSGSFAAKLDYTTGTNPQGVSFGDLDGDGRADMLVANTNSKNISVFRNTGANGTISFAAKVDYATGSAASSAPQEVAIGDLDGDGKLDLAVGNNSTASRSISVFKNISNNSTISFAAKIDIPTGNSLPYDVAISDVNGDGKPDLVMTDPSFNLVSVLKNTSSGAVLSFAAKVDFATGAFPVSPAIKDLNGDGKPELVISNNSSGTVSVFRNTSANGVISFDPKVDYISGSFPNGVSTGDFDGDGKLDIAVVNVGSNTVSVFRNTSSGSLISFAVKADFTTGSGPYNLSASDLDGDGKPDLVIANNDRANTVSVLKNTSTAGNLSFATKVDYAGGTYPYGAATGDLDGDGKADFAVTNLGANTVSVFRNQILSATITINVGSTISTNICAGSPIDIPFSVSPALNANNIFTAQLSDSTGSFANSVTIGTLAGLSSGTIHATIPSNTPTGSNYRLRVVSSSPIVASSANANPITINQSPGSDFAFVAIQNTCLGQQTYPVIDVSGYNIHYHWILSGGGTLDTTTASIAKVNWTTPGTYTLWLTLSNECGYSQQNGFEIKVYAAVPSLVPQIALSGRILTATNATAEQVLGYQWYKDGILINGATDSSYNAVIDGTYTVRFTNTCGIGPVSAPVVVPVKIDQVITMAAISDKRLGDPPFNVTASASSGLPVSLTITTNPVTGVATISGNTITLTGPGTVMVSAAQPGNSTYNPAATVQRTFNVLPVPDLAVQSVLSGAGIIAPKDVVAVSWKVANIGTATSPVNWTERIYMQSATGENRTLLKQSVFSNANMLTAGQTISRTDSVLIPLQLNIGDQGVFVVQLIPDPAIQEAAGSDANDISIQQTPWIVKKILTLSLSDSLVTEGSSQKITATVSRTGSLAAPLVVNITLRHPERFSFPATLTIPTGQAANTFTLSAPDNSAIEGTIGDTLHIQATGFPPADGKISLLDDDKASLAFINLPAQATEGDVVKFKVTTNLALNIPLQVFLTSGNQSRFPLPNSVTIPAGALSADVTVTIQQNNIPELDIPVTINAGASNLNPAKQIIQVNDDDIPGLELVLQTNIISEAAGLNATQATLRRKANSNSIAFTANLSANLPNTLILPASISLKAGENEKTFTIGAIDNTAADGERQVSITAAVLVSSCGCGAPSTSAGSVTAILTVSDNDGPALQLTAAQLTFPEGTVNAGSIRVSRNTPVTAALVVNLSSSDVNEATIAATATIPSGQAFIDVPFTTINDGVPDGNKQVYFKVSATGFSPGSVWIIVTDLNKPDVQVNSVSVPNASVQAMTVFNYQFAVKNSGFATASPGLVVKGYLSADNIVDTSDIPVSVDTLSSSIPAGQTVQIVNAVKAPNLPGQYKLLFIVNPDAAIEELVVTNNTSAPVSFTIRPDYTATAIVALPYYTKGTTIPVTGLAKKTDGTPAANSQIEVFVITNTLRRKVLATTDGNGLYTAQFIPLAGEAGHYSVGACFPGMGDTTQQDAFDILGVLVNGGTIPQFPAILNDTLKGSLTVQNLSSQSLTNFSLIPLNIPGGAVMHFDTIPVFAGNASVTLSYQVIGLALSTGNNYLPANLQAIAGEGSIQKVDIYYYCQAAKAFISADISRIDVTTSQSKGERVVEFNLVNRGRGATGNIFINLPQVNWLASVSPKVLPSLVTGDSTVVTLKFLATADLPFDYAVPGSIVISTQNGNSFSLPFTFKKVADTSGTVKVTVTDQFTYFTASAPKVNGAHVQIKNYFSGVVYADGFTDTAGVFTASGIPEGKHRIVVDKEKHLSYDGTTTVDPGNTVESTVFINYQAITFSWSVVPTAVQDQYDITLTTKFETNIPIPVVTIQMPDTLPKLTGTDIYAFNVTLTNQGLITAEEVTLNLPANDEEYEFVTNYVTADILAQQSIQVPVIMRRRTTPVVSGSYGYPSIAGISSFLGMNPSESSGASSAAATSPNGCRAFTDIVWRYPCGISIVVWQKNAAISDYTDRSCGGGDRIFVNPRNVTNPPCFNCAGGTGGGGTAAGSTPEYKSDTKSCVKCITNIGEAIVGCIPGEEFATGVLCESGVIIEGGSLRDKSYKSFICVADIALGIAAPVLACIKGAVLAINECRKGSAGGEHSFNKQDKNKLSNNNNPFSDVFTEISNNLQTVINTYTTRSAWNKEYFGDMINTNGWSTFYPLVKTYILSLDTIPLNVQIDISNKMAGYEITTATLNAFFARWNTSAVAYAQGIFSPNTQYPNIINWTLAQSYYDSLVNDHNFAVNKGFQNVEDMHKKSYASLDTIINGQKNAVCASVTVQFSQELTMTREAFDGTLSIFNGHPTDKMDSLSVNIQITDENGVPSNGLFDIQTKSLTSITDVTGTGAINAQQTGVAKFTFIPGLMAAPQTPKVYNFGGTIRYFDPYAQAIVSLPLSAVQLTVNPSPNLMLHYFMERNILGDDALTTPDIEPSIPAELAVMVENQGYGPAVNMTISSSQPKVVDNEKGLAINFNLIGSNFQGQPKQLGLTNINFGTVPALQTRIGQWYFTSSLLGKFVSYDAQVVHNNSNGNPGLSLVKGVKLHELTKSIRLYGGLDDGINDFLVNDIFDVDDVPDIIYYSQGLQTAKVIPAAAGSFSSAVGPPAFTNILTVNASDTGWNYIKLNDPGNKLYDIVSVTRNDGQVIPLDNAWLTFVTLPVSRPPVYENKFHFVDRFTSTTPVTYTVVWKPGNLNVPRVDSITGAPKDVTTTQVKSLKVVFSKSIDPASFTYEDLSLNFQGGANIANNSIVISQVDSATFNVDLSSLTTGNGFYALTVQAANIKDIYSINGTVGKQVTWTQFLTVPTVQAFLGIPANRVAASFDTINVLFNLPIDESTVTPDRFTISKNGIVLNNKVTIDSVRADHKLFYLSGLKNVLTTSGDYVFTVDLPNIQSVTHVAGVQTQSVILTLDNTGPQLLRLEKSVTGGLDSQHVTFVTINFNKAVAGFNTASVQLTRNGAVLPLDIAQLSSQDLSLWMAGNFGMLTYPDGNYTFTVNLAGIKDATGNYGTGSQQISWTVNRAALITISNLMITPDLGFSGTDGVTSGQTLNAAFTLSANASQVTVSQVDLSGEIVLSNVPNVAAGNVSLPVVLSSGGNTSIKVTAIGANGGVTTVQYPLYIDQLALSANWIFTANQQLARQVDTIPVLFSAKLLTGAEVLNAIQFKRNGTAVSTAGLTVQALNDTLYKIAGLRQASSVAGNYQLTVNTQAIHKYSSGLAGNLPASTSWTVISSNRAPLAKAGNDVTVAAPGVFTLDASASSDPDGDSITYRWIAPAALVLSDSTTARPTFAVTAANQGQTYALLLIVSDGSLFSTAVVNVTVAAAPTGVQVKVKAFLQGPYNEAGGLMNDSLRAKSLLPVTDPYPSLGFTVVNGVSTSSVPAGVFAVTGNTAVVDWVWLELRSSTNPAQVVATQTALIRRDGAVVGLDGNSPVYFNNTAEGSYYIAIRHRNHLGVMTRTALALNTSAATAIDFSSPLTGTYGTDARATQNGVMTMWAGDVNANRQVSYNGASNDKNAVLGKVGLSTANNILTVYDRADVNMDGIVKYNGASNDKNVILGVIGLTTPNKIIIEQIPNQ